MMKSEIMKKVLIFNLIEILNHILSPDHISIF